jgi:hypothetical protein
LIVGICSTRPKPSRREARPGKLKNAKTHQGLHLRRPGVFHQTPSDKIVIESGYVENSGFP